jgi:MFS transporter, DHA2 family, multidrug resistance protein
MSLTAVSAPPAASPAPATLSPRPLIGVAAVIAGAFISTINTRLTSVGLADLRGGLSLGFDEGSWFSTAFTSAQLGVCLSAAWFSVVFGPRRMLLWSAAIFAASSALPPFTRDPDALMALQVVRGLSVGTFVPATIGFILRELPPGWWSWGLAAYAFRYVFSQNISSSLEAFYDENGLWRWLFWQNLVLTPLMMMLIWFGMRRQAVNVSLLRAGDWGGIVLAGLALSLIYAALDQGNRLDWLNSGVIVGLLASGGFGLVAFVLNEMIVERPLIDFRLPDLNVWIAVIMIGIYGFGSSATGFVLPDYLTRIQGLRSLEIGDVLNWIALPQIVLVPLIAWWLRYVDARLTFAGGLALIAVGSWMCTGLTHDWANDDFLPSQLVEAVGLAVGITSLIIFAIANLRPAAAITVAGLIQAGRLLGAESGLAFIQTYVRVREQVYSNLIGLNVSTGVAVTEDRTALFS